MKDPTWAALLAIASVVWWEETMVAWSVAYWVGSMVGSMDER